MAVPHKIHIRIKGGWKRAENERATVCDRCETRLWLAPHGGIYCDNLHAELGSGVKPAR